MTESSARHRQPNRVRLVVADVDGTLVTPDKIVTPRARAAVRQVMKADIAFTITSGRPPRGMKALIDDLQVRSPIAAFNGGLFVRPDLSVLRRYVISREVATSVIDNMTRGGLDVWGGENVDVAGTDQCRPREGQTCRRVRRSRHGSNRAQALRHVLSDAPDEHLYPAARIRLAEGAVIWWVDKEAAGGRLS